MQRSAARASKTVLAPVDVDRYLNPLADTPHFLEYAFYLLGDVQGKTVLDLGCGSGENLIALVKRGARVTGVDISPDLIEIARRRLISYGLNAALKVCSVYRMGLASESVDIVFIIGLLHHVDLFHALTEVRRVLRPGGLLVLKEPIRFSRTLDRMRRFFPAPTQDISRFEHPMTRNELLVVTKGLEVIAQRNFRLPFVPLLSRFRFAKKRLWLFDRWLLSTAPMLEYFATVKVMSLRK